MKKKKKKKRKKEKKRGGVKTFRIKFEANLLHWHNEQRQLTQLKINFYKTS